MAEEDLLMGVNDLGGSVLMGLIVNVGVQSGSVGRRVGSSCGNV